MAIITREHDIMLYRILEKMRAGERINFADKLIIGDIKCKLSALDYWAESRTTQIIMQDLRGKLFYIDEYFERGSKCIGTTPEPAPDCKGYEEGIT